MLQTKSNEGNGSNVLPLGTTNIDAAA